MFKEDNEWYLQSNGFRQHEGYYYHLGRRIVVTEEVVYDFEPEKIKEHVEGVNPDLITFLFARYPNKKLTDEIIKRHQWVGHSEIISLLDE